jgi:trans-aconitate methyltransferase
MLVRQAMAATDGVKRVVELGCGPGWFIADLAAEHPRVEFVGVDIHAAMIEHARATYQLPNLRFERRDIVTEPLPESAEFVFSIDVLHHIEDLHAFFGAVRRTCTGRWLAVEPNVFHPWVFLLIERMKWNDLDEDQFRPWVAEPLFRRTGFTFVRRYVHLFPGFFPKLPKILERIETWFENARFVGGSVVYDLR